jgi:antitoxin CcdA
MRMNLAYDLQAPKKPTNVSINSDLLAKARALKINVSATLESALADIVAARRRELWKEENQSAIKAYNQLIEEAGVACDGLRSF